MSGAEAAIAGVGFLCNAMQIVTFGRDVLQVCRQIRASSSPDPNLQGYLKSAEACFSQRKAYFDQMKASASAASQAQGLNSDLQHIIEVGKKLDDSMDELQSKFAKLHLNSASKGGIRGSARTVKKAVASMWQSNQLKSLEENVKRYESLLHGVMVHNICNQLQAAKIQTSKSFHQLNQDLQSFITKLADGCTKLSELSLASLETRDRVTQEHETTRTAINQGFTSTQGAVSSMHNSMSQRLQESAQRDLSSDLKKRHERLLDSLRFSEMNSRKNQVSENYPGTFLWVFKKKSDGSQTQRVSRAETYNKDGDIHMNDASTSAPGTGSQSPVSFPSWLECDANLFWISGKPASGKSSLMKFLATNSLTIEHLRIWQRSIQMSDGKLRIITHYFWKAGESLQNNIQGMMLSLLHQVLNKDLCLAQRLWEDQENVSDKRAYGDWSLKELRHALCRTIRSSGDAFCIFLDGTDEAKELEHLSWRDRGNSQIIHDLLCLSNVKICASSREEHPFCLFFEGMPRLRIHLLTYGDIYRFAENKLESSSVDCNYRGHILRTIVEKANGVFLWVVLVLDSVNRAIRSGTASTDEIQERLEQTPADLTDLLIDMWERPGDDAKLSSYKTDASRYFSLVVTAKRMEEDIGWEHVSGFPHHMNSILVIATALEDEPVTSIIHKGRSIQAEELQDRCSRVANRLRLISRGLLETTTSANWDCKGDPRLMDYNKQRINFIHRSAFDFITDTQFGRERLSSCQWSPVEQVSRLLGGHLVRSRFLKTVLFETATAVYNITIKYLLEGVGPADPPKNGLTSSNGQDTAQTYEQTYGGRIIGSVLPPINVPLTGGATHGIVRVPASQEGAIVPLSTVKISFDSEFIKLVDAYYAGDSIFWTISWEKLPTEEGKNPQSVDVITSIPHTQFGGLTSWTRIVQPYTVVFYVLEK
ncbi:hypothetical protein FPSE_10676 [Fusarium pseudograminearum CS3096]|uniref:NACHT domain-containing protein n=1 Tax=Fusarium pseudograminearum (strain CS3096) TaxID=1028729 RepID=K3V6W4_FUSPC|nr:hypothetical protein FPSE_10676 [Fusarium pseudograminearum CS3096]EKJ69152.1 hypothetical protein FPSE_10676 [Fusarium pseudograminearum CS3096]